MLDELNRRSFLGLGLSAAVLSRTSGVLRFADASSRTRAAEPSDNFPQQDRALVLEMVTVAHGNPARVRELLAVQPALAKTSYDWGFGDWESPIDAAAHVGQREIAELLLKSGARPTIFSAAMLGQLSVVKAFMEAAPGIERTLGPHSITLLAHARAGGTQARPVFDFLEAAGSADIAPPLAELSVADRAACIGFYAFGTDISQRLEVGLTGETLFIQRAGVSKRTIRYVGNHEFRPAGAEHVRIRFEFVGGNAASLTVNAPQLLVTAKRVTV